MVKNTKSHLKLTIIFSVLITIACLLFGTCIWYARFFGLVGFNSILFTLTNEVGTANSDLFGNYLLTAFLPSVAVGLLLSFLLWFRTKKEKPTVNEDPSHKYKMRDHFSMIVSVIICALLLIVTVRITGLDQWVINYFSISDLFEKEYVDPKVAQVEFPDKKQNLIVIYLESMETTFFDSGKGGALPYNVIPELYDLAKNNTNFSHNNDVGGFRFTEGTGWTIGAMVGSTSGVPLYTYEQDANEMGNNIYFLKGLTTMNDILHDNGYYQSLMVGSDSNFGGRNKYFTQHGVDKVYDYYTAIEDQIIPSDHYVWWGMEDKYLYDYAKQELAEIAQQDQPFAFTMLTVDTHHPDGCVCDLCGSQYKEQYENVFACASKQLNDFINWLKKQSFYDDTTIVITGDHTSMNQAYIDRNVDTANYQRHVYNCFINAVQKAKNTKNRSFTTVDLFPTILASMGCTIPGDHLGLGINLFSNEATLSEKYGFDNFNAMLAQHSEYYDDHFYFH